MSLTYKRKEKGEFPVFRGKKKVQKFFRPTEEKKKGPINKEKLKNEE